MFDFTRVETYAKSLTKLRIEADQNVLQISGENVLRLKPLFHVKIKLF